MGIVFLASCRSGNADNTQRSEDKAQENQASHSNDAQANNKKSWFKVPIHFKDYHVDTFRGPRKPVDFSSHPIAERFHEKITETVGRQGLNFAGRYSLVSWSCGKDCQNVAIVDLKTGAVYTGPAATNGYAFQKRSRLLVVNPPDRNGYYTDCSYCAPQLWVWNSNLKKFHRLY